jgi:hypothetical protein
VTDRLVRKIGALLDLSWVYADLAPYYSEIGRPSIDPVLRRKSWPPTILTDHHYPPKTVALATTLKTISVRAFPLLTQSGHQVCRSC